MVSAVKSFLKEHKKYAPVVFFMGGFIWDGLTLGRIDGWYSNFILFTYLTSLTLSIYIFNVSDDGRWKGTFLEPYEEYAPLAIQFFLGGLSSAYVIFFFQSVSFTKTLVFFLILVFLLISNELFKHRISNKYLQFGAYFFVNFTFCTFFFPIIAGTMNTFIFMISGLISLFFTLWVILYIYRKSPSTRAEVSKGKLGILVLSIYVLINTCYYFNLIPPVPLSLQNGIVAYNVEKSKTTFFVTFEQSQIYGLWKSFDPIFHYASGDTVFIYTSIFAPTNLEKRVSHRWQWYDPEAGAWKITDRIRYEVKGGREGGYRGYTFKENLRPGRWRVDVTTREGLVLGEINFKVVNDSLSLGDHLIRKEFE